MVLVLIGSAIGVIAAMAANRLMVSYLYAVSPRDPLVIAGAVALLIVIGCAATFLPARRAARVDPMVALRYE
jgi:putative ABC transport system permease protein